MKFITLENLSQFWSNIKREIDNIKASMGNKADTVEKAFGVNLENHTAMLNNVVSRKKQMLPNILNNLD